MRTYKKQELKRNTEKFVIAVTTVVAALLLLKKQDRNKLEKTKKKTSGIKVFQFQHKLEI